MTLEGALLHDSTPAQVGPLSQPLVHDTKRGNACKRCCHAGEDRASMGPRSHERGNVVCQVKRQLPIAELIQLLDQQRPENLLRAHSPTTNIAPCRWGDRLQVLQYQLIEFRMGIERHHGPEDNTLGQTIGKPTALSPGANTDTKLLIYGLFQKG